MGKKRIEVNKAKVPVIQTSNKQNSKIEPKKPTEKVMKGPNINKIDKKRGRKEFESGMVKLTEDNHSQGNKNALDLLMNTSTDQINKENKGKGKKKLKVDG